MQPIFTFNQEDAKKAGPSGATESGAYTGIIRTALFSASRDPDSKSESMEFSVDSDVGQINFLRVSYIGRDGNPLQGGNAMIQAIMGLTGVKALHSTEAVNSQNETEYHCKELEGKPIGFVLQKVLYTKNTGADGYRFEIRQAFGTKTRKTYKEGIEGLPAETVDKLVATLSDKDERQQNVPGPAGGASSNQQRSMLGAQHQPAQSNLQRNSGNRIQPPAQTSQEQSWDDDIPF